MSDGQMAAIAAAEDMPTGPVGPRVWAFPPEPGDEVTAVRTDDGDLYLRCDGFAKNGCAYTGSLPHASWRGSHGIHWTWRELAEFEPITDATGEVAP